MDDDDHFHHVAIERFVEYIQIKTVQPQPDYNGAFEFLKRYAQELDLDYFVIRTDEDRQAAVLTWSSSSNDTSILLNSHIDVVPVFEEYWIVPPFSGEIRDEKIYGRGTPDMKWYMPDEIDTQISEVVFILYSVGIQYLEAIRRLKSIKYEPKRTIHCLFVPDEEIGGARGMKKLVELDQFKALNVGLVLDEGLASETDVFQVYYGNRSGLWVDFILKGETGHGSRFIKNTAGEKAQFVINEMLSYRLREQQHLETNQTSSKPLQLGNVTTINLTKISGGVQVNVVPDQYILSFDCRTKPDGYHAFKEFLADVVRRTPKESNDEVKLNYIADDGPVILTDIEQSSWWLKCFEQTFEEMNCKTNWTVFPAGTDSRFVRSIGYPAIGFSPIVNTPILLHDHNEYLPKDVFLYGIDIYVKLIEKLTGAI